MTWMTDAEVFYRERDDEIRDIVHRLEIVTYESGGHTLFNPNEIIDHNNDEVRLTQMHSFYFLTFIFNR